ncbi:MAG: alpha/beta fold hydrolase [bacterium]|nr:alpha/beta fold hydrolase [bacterium]
MNDLSENSSNEFILSFEDSADRVPVLWLHGFPLNNTMWDLQVAGLSDVARLITPDLRGHGLTEATSVTPYSMELMAGDCIRILDHLGCQGPVVVAGLSMGGYLAFEICRRFPERVAGLILAATKATADTEEVKLNRDNSARIVMSDGVKPVVDGLLPKLLSPKAYEDDPDLVDFLRDMMLLTSPEGIAGAQGAMRDRPDSTPDLPDLNIPTLIIHGDEDQLIPLDEAKAMAAALPEAELVIIPGAGHMPNLEQPMVFNDAVREFLEVFYGE